MSAHEEILDLRQRMGQSIIGQEDVVERVLLGLLANGNLLLEGLPGLAKTRTIKALAVNLDAKLSRIQFTPDLLPSDVTGSEVLRHRLILSYEADADLEFIMDFLTVLYKPDVEIFGAHYAFGMFLPFVHADIDTGIRLGGLERRRQDDVFGLGDVTLIPGILFWNKGNFHFTFAEYIIAPTGEHDSDDLANVGLNYWTFDTNVAVLMRKPVRTIRSTLVITIIRKIRIRITKQVRSFISISWSINFSLSHGRLVFTGFTLNKSPVIAVLVPC